jgi:amino acid permease
LSVLDVTTAVILIVILLIGAVVTNRIIRNRRNRIPTRKDIYDNSSKQSTHSQSTSPMLLWLQKNKLKILAAIVTFILLIIVMSESVVIVQAGHRGVVLYVGAVENKVLGEGLHFIVPFAEQVNTARSTYA